MKSNQGNGQARGFPVFPLVALGILISCAALWFAYESASKRAEMPLQDSARDKPASTTGSDRAAPHDQGSADQAPETGSENTGDAAVPAPGSSDEGISIDGSGKPGGRRKPGPKPVEPSRASVEIIRISEPVSPFSVYVTDDASAAPVGGAMVTAEVTNRAADHAKTDSSGLASLKLPEKFRASVAVMLSGYEPMYTWFDHDGQGDRAYTVRIRKSAGLGSYLEFYDVLHGPPVAAVEVQFSWSYRRDRGGSGSFYAESDSSGRVNLNPAAPVRIQKVRAMSAGYHTAVFEMPGGDAGIPVRVPLLAKSTTRVSVLSQGGKPLADAHVRFSVGSPFFGGFSADARTDALGNALFESLEIDPFGNMTLVADHQDCLPEEQTFSLQEFASLRGNPVIFLQIGDTIAGKVGSGAGPPAGWVVEAAPQISGSPHTPPGAYVPVRSAVVDASGEFVLKGLPRGGLRVRVRSGGEVLSETVIAVLSGPVTIDPAPALVAIEAVMQDGKAAAGTRVFFRRRDGVFEDAEHIGLTGQDGVLRVRAAAPGEYDGAVTFQDGVEKGFDLSLPPGARAASLKVLR